MTFPAASRSPCVFCPNLVVFGSVGSGERRQADRGQKVHICELKMGGYVNILTLAIFSGSFTDPKTNTGGEAVCFLNLGKVPTFLAS